MMSGVEVIMKLLGMAGLLLLCASLAAGADISGKMDGRCPSSGRGYSYDVHV
jgi:hypothetical protein